MNDRASKIRTLNDLARTTFVGCRVIVTQGVQSLYDIASVLDKVRKYDAFSDDNDPYGEHDFGSFKHNGETIFWKMDYYDRTLKVGSEDPADPKVTTRVLTVMLSSEY